MNKLLLAAITGASIIASCHAAAAESGPWTKYATTESKTIPLPAYVDKVGGFKGLTTDAAQVMYFSARCATVFTVMGTTVENDTRPAAKDFRKAMDSAALYYISAGKTAAKFMGNAESFPKLYTNMVKKIGLEYISAMTATYESTGEMFSGPLVKGDMESCKAFSAFLAEKP